MAVRTMYCTFKLWVFQTPFTWNAFRLWKIQVVNHSIHWILDVRDEDICAGTGDRRAELQLFHSSCSGLKLPQCHQAWHQGLPIPILASMLRHKMVPGTLMHQIYHLESTELGNLCPTSHWTWRRRFARDAHVLGFLFLLTKQNHLWHMHLLTYVFTATNYSWNRTFSNWGRKENKICLLSTQEKLMNSCKSTSKSEGWVWLSMVQKMSGILIESRLSHVFMLTAFITVTTRAKLMLPCCLMKYISLPSSCNKLVIK